MHDIPDHFRTSITTDHMQNTRQSAKNPFPRIGSVDPIGGFITMNHLALANAVLDLVDLAHRPLSSPFHDLIDPTLADLNLMQVEQCLLSAGIAHVLLLAVIHHRRFQPASECTVHLQPSRWFFNLRRTTLRTGHAILPYFNHLGRCLRQLGDLVHIRPNDPLRCSGRCDIYNMTLHVTQWCDQVGQQTCAHAFHAQWAVHVDVFVDPGGKLPF